MALNNVNVFIIGTDSCIYHWNNLTSFWDKTGNETFIYDPVAVSFAPGRVDVFAIGTDGALYHKWLSGPIWGPTLNTWENLGHVWKEKPVVVSRGPNLLDVFTVGTDRLIYWNSWDGSQWTGFAPVDPRGGQAFRGLFAPSVVSINQGRMDLFSVGLDSGVYHAFWASGQGWSLFSKITSDAPIVSSLKATKLGTQIHVFGLDYYSRLSHMWYDFANGGWGSEHFDELKYRGNPEAVLRSSGTTIDAFINGTDGSVVHYWYDVNVAAWTHEVLSGSVIIRDITAVPLSSGDLDVFVVSTNDQPEYKAWTPATLWQPYVGLIGLSNSAVAAA